MNTSSILLAHCIEILNRLSPEALNDALHELGEIEKWYKESTGETASIGPVVTMTIPAVPLPRQVRPPFAYETVFNERNTRL